MELDIVMEDEMPELHVFGSDIPGNEAKTPQAVDRLVEQAASVLGVQYIQPRYLKLSMFNMGMSNDLPITPAKIAFHVVPCNVAPSNEETTV